MMWPCGASAARTGGRPRDEHGPEPLCLLGRGRSGDVHLQLVQALQVEGDRPLGAVDLPSEGVLAPGGEARGLDRADRPVVEGDDGLDRVVDLAPGLKVAVAAATDSISHEIARQVDHVRAEIPQRSQARERLVEAPDLVVDRPHSCR